MIASTQNARIKAARKLSERKERYAAGQFLVEGVRLLRDAWQSGIRPAAVFYAGELVAANPPALALLDELQAAGVECLACTPPVFASLTDTVTPQGLAGVMPLLQRPLAEPLRLALVLDGVRDPGNAGTLLRSAAAAGADVVFFGPGSVDPYNDKVVRAGMGAHFRVPLRVCATWAQVESLLPATLTRFVAAAGAIHTYDQVDWRQPCALIVGGEAEGASASAHARATPIAIPMHNGVESLNAGVAGSIVLFEAARQRRAG
jgi:TrmH family RNA methyltransferase